MSTVDRVVLGELDPVATLIGEPNQSAVVERNGRLFLSGRFALRVAHAQTNFLPIDPFNAIVTRTPDQLALASMARAAFTFAQTFVVQPHILGPWLAATTASLQRRSTGSSSVLLSLDDASLSLVPDVPLDPGQRFFYPTSGGTARTQLLPSSIGSIPVFGFFVRPLDEGGFGIDFGGLATGATIDPHDAVALAVPGDTFLRFRIPLLTPTAFAETTAPLTLDGDSSRFGLRVTTLDQTGIRLNEDLGAGMSGVRAARISVSSGWMSVESMHDTVGDVRVARIDAEADGQETHLLARPASVEFHMALARNDGSLLHQERPQFVYRDASVMDAGARLTPRDRHYGLRLRGLSADGGAQARLDATVARVFLHPTGRFEYAGGEDFTVRGEQVTSLLVPKPDPEDGTTRLLTIPAGIARLEVQTPRVPSSVDRRIVLNTSNVEAQRLRLLGPRISVPPGGSVGADLNTTGARLFARWNLGLDAGRPSFDFRVNDQGVFPVLDQQWPSVFNGKNDAFALLEHPGARITFNPDATALALSGVSALAAPPKTSLKFETHTDGKEILVYTSFVAVLTLKDKIIEYVLSSIEESLDDPVVRFELQGLEDKVIFPKREAEGLLAVFCDETPGGCGDAEIDKFIAINRREGKSRLVWPFAIGLAAFLWDETLGSFTAISRRRDPTRRPGMSLDYSSRDSVDFASFGWTADDRERFKQEPLLWPRLSERTGAQLDPSDPFWRGVLFRDMPLVIPIDPDLVGKFARFLRAFFDTINDNLLLEYGWKDEAGATWLAGFVKPDGISLAPTEDWRKVFDLRLIRFVTRGSAGRVIGADGEIEVVLPKITEKSTGEPVRFTGLFGLSTTNGFKLERIEFAINDPDVETTSIPGFDKIRLRRFGTDLKTLQLDLELVPNARLAEALPFLGGGQRLSLRGVVSLSGDTPGGWTLAIEREIHTNLFGRFPTTIQSLSLTFGAGNALDMHARIHLGVAGLGSVGARLKLRQAGDTWTFDVELDEISASIGIGDFRLEGALGWSSEDNASGAVPAGAMTAAAQRDFWGDIRLSTGGIVDTRLLLRIGNKGEVSYWIGALQLPDLNFGSAAKLKKPALLIARHVDFADDKKHLAEFLANAQASIAKVVRPPDTGAGRRWIADNWKPSGDVGTLVAASGFLHVHDEIAAAPDGSDEDDFCCLAVTDTGLIRAEATVMFLKLTKARFGLAVDLPNKKFSAAIVLPKFNYGAFTVNAGQIGFGLGWGDRPHFLVSVGWPEPIDGDVMNRDWSKSVMLRWDGAFPINTFWGGMKSEIGNGGLFLGFAFRAGWTWEYSVSILGLAKGSASLGLAVGGTVEIFFGVDGPALTSTSFIPTRALTGTANRPHHVIRQYTSASRAWGAEAQEDERLRDVLQFVMPRIDAHVTAMSSVSVTARVIYYADVWGKASAELLGVTIAAIDIGAHAAFLGCIALLPSFKIVQLKAEVGFHLSVRIGCVEFGASASIDISLIDLGPCPHLDAAPALLPAPPLQVLA